MTNNVVVKNSSVHGKGIFAFKDFNKDDFILAIDDSHIILDASKLTSKQHAFDLDYFDDKTILMQSPEKYINHSCNPNAYVKTEKGVRNVYTMRDILEGDEITFDYAINGDNEGTFECHCGSKNCRKMYQGNFFKLPIETQIKYLPYLDVWFAKKYKKQIDKLHN